MAAAYRRAGLTCLHPDGLRAAAAYIDNLRPVQGKHLLTSGAGRPILDGLLLQPMAHDVRCDAALFRQLALTHAPRVVVMMMTFGGID